MASERKVVFSTDVDQETAELFDKIAESNLRSRAGHLLYLIQKEVASVTPTEEGAA